MLKSREFGISTFVHLTFLAMMVSTALRPAEKYLGNAGIWFLYLAAAIALIAFVTNKKLGWTSRLLESSVFHWSVVLVLGAMSALFYPAADALKLVNQGQDQDDCTILGIEALLQFQNPVATPTYFGNPCSNLLGAIIPHAPFVLLGNMGLAGPVFLAAGVLFLKRTGVNPRVIGLTLAILAGIPATLELMVNGSDFVFIGIAVLIVGRLLDLMRQGLFTESRWVWCVAVLTALVATTRINMLLFAAVVGLVFLCLRIRLLPLILATAVALLVNIGVYFSDPQSFAPLHLIEKGQSLVPGALYLLMLALTAIALLLGLIRQSVPKRYPQEFLLVSFGIHLVFLAYGDLAFNRLFDFFWWEGANYLFLLTPLSVFLASASIIKLSQGTERG